MKIECVYNKHFFENMHTIMKMHKYNFITDASNTIWHINDVEEILINEFGYRRTANRSIQ